MPKSSKKRQTPSDIFGAVAGIRPKEEPAEEQEEVQTGVQAESAGEQTQIEEPAPEQVPEVTLPAETPGEAKVEIKEFSSEPDPAVAEAKQKIVEATAPNGGYLALITPSTEKKSVLLFCGKARVVPAEPGSVEKAWATAKNAGVSPIAFSDEVHKYLKCPVVMTYMGRDLDFSASMGIRENIPGAAYVEIR